MQIFRGKALLFATFVKHWQTELITASGLECNFSCIIVFPAKDGNSQYLFRKQLKILILNTNWALGILY